MAALKANSFVKSVAVAGTAEALKSSRTLVRAFLVEADIANTNNMFLGGTDVSSVTGLNLIPGEKTPLFDDPAGEGSEPIDLAQVFLDTTTNAESVRVFFLV